jgi:hypothetical protein
MIELVIHAACRLARPLERLKQKHVAFQQRMVSCRCSADMSYLVRHMQRMRAIEGKARELHGTVHDSRHTIIRYATIGTVMPTTSAGTCRHMTRCSSATRCSFMQAKRIQRKAQEEALTGQQLDEPAPARAALAGLVTASSSAAAAAAARHRQQQEGPAAASHGVIAPRSSIAAALAAAAPAAGCSNTGLQILADEDFDGEGLAGSSEPGWVAGRGNLKTLASYTQVCRRSAA